MWRRRLLSIPLYLLLWCFWWTNLPWLLVLALLVDLLRWRRFATIRTLFFMGTYLTAEVFGVLACFVIWLIPASEATFLERNYRLQQQFNAALFQAGRILYGMQVKTEWESPETGLGTKPVLLFIRHTSTADTVLPVTFFSGPSGIRLRFVLKAELQFDPCLDIVGNRVPNCFVRRGSGEGEKELAKVRSLAQNLGPGDGILIYPEGTRFTVGKRKKLLEKESTRARTERFQHVLPPHPGGPLALLEETLPEVDVWFCAHRGYEGAGSFGELINGGLVGQTVRLHFWKVAGSEVPKEGRAEWLDAEWAKLDAWVGTA